MTVKIEVGQVWADLDMRNARMEQVGGPVEPRTVQIVELPTQSKPGVMKVLRAPRNEKSEGQLRQFTEGKLRECYALVRRHGDGHGDGIAEAAARGEVEL